MADDRWHRMVRDFFAKHRCETPLFAEIAQEFLGYLHDERQPEEYDPPFMLELAHYEWVELAVSVSDEDRNAPPADPNGDLLAGSPVVSPVAWNLSYRYPVHRIAPEFQPQAPGDGPTHLVRIWLDLDRSASVPLGVREQVLVSDEAFNYTPVPSPDGSRIAYTAESGSAAQIVVMDLATAERRILTENGYAYVDTWTPDGDWIAVTRWDPEDDRREVWLIDPDGEEPDEPLLRGSDRLASDVAFRPVRR